MRKISGTLAIALAATACSSPSATSGNVAGRECRELTANTPAQSALESKFQGSVFTIVIENKSRAQLLAGTQAPYLRQLAEDNAVANGYTDTMVHPSEPNYIWMVSGQNFGILDNGSPANHHVASRSHLVDQLEHAGKTWKAYQESMGEPCRLTDNGLYAVKHDPFVFFDDVVGWQGSQPLRQQRCIDHVVDYSQLDADLAAGNVADYVFITPDLMSDMHDGSIPHGDAWLAREVPKILASDAWTNGGVLVITADEGEGQGDDPPFVLISPLGKKHYISSVTYDTSSFLKTVQAIMGVEALPCGGDNAGVVETMGDLFEAPLPAM